MRTILLIALVLTFTAGETAARHRRHSHCRYWGHVPRVMLAPSSDALSRSSRAYARGQMLEFPPSTWQLQPPDPKWRGQRYVSPEGDAWLAFYASPTAGEPVSAHFKTLAFADGEEIIALQADRLQLAVRAPAALLPGADE